MALIAEMRRKLRGIDPAGCCGQVCDGRCREASIRQRQYERRLASPGSVRAS